MKNIILAGVISVMASSAFAGGYSAPTMEGPVMAPEIVVESAVESSGNDEWVGVLMTFITIVVLGFGG